MATTSSRKSLLITTYNQPLQFITLGLFMASALAWNEAVKSFLRNVYPKKCSNLAGHFIYAICITLLAILVFNTIQKYIKDNIKNDLLK